MDSTLVNNQYSLSIRIFSDGFSLYVYDENFQILSHKHEKSKQTDDLEFIRKMFESNKEIHDAYKTISIICESDYHTLVPEIFFKLENQNDLLKLHHPSLPDSSRIFYTKQEQLESVLIYSLDEKLLKEISLYFQQITPESHLVHITKKITTEQKDKFTLWIRPEKIDCIVYNHHKMLLLNKFSYTSPEDIAYHVLNVYQQLELNPNEFLLEIFDDGNNQIESILKKYISTVIIKPKQSAYEDYQWEV
jgi:hypothetical protein